ncbi:methyltransferase domain-containing protein [Sphingomonas sp. SRS2]|uniref:methyltransferase domain-containing protein n=1 Tax=Sphingomonas sp. SRS2 TaxID=133190 RepID=UPI00061849FC|nr:methyltransferase domain-containing protein [Sphingomonas sp. SRS2]KKC27949.1 methyltransferase type 12 [Sphingomonas sp. SRS2]
MRSLTRPAIEEEQMDAPDLDPAIYAAVLGDLAAVNRWTFAARPTIDFVARAVGDRRRFTLLDVGFGDGDMLRAIARWAEKSGIEAMLTGIDLNPKSRCVADRASPGGPDITYLTGDYVDLLHAAEPDGGFDLIISSLVAHHMSQQELLTFLHKMESCAKRGWHINDLHRHRFAYLGFPLLAFVMGWHRIVRQDGQLSIARAFRPAEWPPILAKAGLGAEARIRRCFPFRICVERLR